MSSTDPYQALAEKFLGNAALNNPSVIAFLNALREDAVVPASVRSIVEHCPDAAAVLNASGECLCVNQQLSVLAGLTSDKSETESWQVLLSELEDAGKLIKATGPVKEKKFSRLNIRTKVGQDLEVNVSAVELNGESGWFCVLKNVTKLRELQRNFSNLSRIQHTVLNGTPYSIMYTNRDGLIVAVNKNAEDLLGYKTEDLVGRESPLYFIDKKFLKERAREFSAELKQEVPIGFGMLTLWARNGVVDTKDWLCLTKSGERRNMLLSTSAIDSENSGVAGYLLVFRDISDQKNAQEALRLSEERYRNIVERSSDIIYKSDEKGRFTFVNAVAEKITGYTSENLKKMKYLDLVQEGYQEVVFNFYAAQLRSQTPSTYYEFPIRTRDGKQLWIGQSVQLSKNEQGAPELVALAIDISRQKAAEHSMKESNEELELFRELMNYSTDAVIVTTEEGQLFYINNEASRRFGISMKDAHQKGISDVDPDYSSAETWRKHVAALKEAGTLTYEKTYRTKGDKADLPVEISEKYIRIDRQGYIVATSRDLTERKRTEKIIGEQEEKYRNIIANMNLGLLEVDLQDRILYVNQGFCDISGYTQEELVGRTASELFVEEENREKISNMLNRREAGNADMYEVLITTKNGDKRWWMISGAPQYNGNGKLIGSIGIHLDISDQKRLSEELQVAIVSAEQASRAKEAFLANMSHEIRTPLNGLIGMIRELSNEKLTDKQRKYILNASVASQHLLSVLNNVLDITRIEAGELSLEQRPFDLAETLHQAKRIMNSSARQKGLFLGLSTHEVKNSTYIGDAFRLRQVILNLLGNSIKFTSQGGLFVECRLLNEGSDADELLIVVEDTGIGMEKEYQDRLFSKFSQEDSSISRKYGGTGLGMAIAYEIIQLMNGTISVSSERNKGTVVEVRLFLKPGIGAEPNKNKRTADQNIEGMRVLLVEDNDFNMAVANRSLSREGCVVTEAHNGAEAIEHLKTNTFDAVLMDMQMPVMNGIEATRCIRQELKLDVPVIALTANAFRTEIEACRAVGMNDYITKPYDEKQLYEVLALYRPVTDSMQLEITNQQTGESTSPVLDAPLFDLANLREISAGDHEFVNRMLLLFAEQSRTTLMELHKAVKEDNYAEIARLAHRIKPGIDNLRVISLKQTIRELENAASGKSDMNLVPELIARVDEILTQIVRQVIGHN